MDKWLSQIAPMLNPSTPVTLQLLAVYAPRFVPVIQADGLRYHDQPPCWQNIIISGFHFPENRVMQPLHRVIMTK